MSGAKKKSSPATVPLGSAKRKREIWQRRNIASTGLRPALPGPLSTYPRAVWDDLHSIKERSTELRCLPTRAYDVEAAKRPVRIATLNVQAIAYAMWIAVRQTT